MDTHARRSIWEMLKKYKNDKIIILSTHFMDEADILGDRIAIMGKGKLITCGTSTFLKNEYGAGYNMVIQKINETDGSEELIKFIKENIEKSIVDYDIGSKIAFTLPLSEVHKFSSVL